MIKVMFICSGNICRSPMAEGLAIAKLARLNILAQVCSAGTLKIEGESASLHAVEAMKNIGIDISHHRSQGIRISLLTTCDHIVVMAPEHKKMLHGDAPELTEKIVCMWEFGEHSRPLTGITDPVGQNLDAFIACRNRLNICLDGWLEALL